MRLTALLASVTVEAYRVYSWEKIV